MTPDRVSTLSSQWSPRERWGLGVGSALYTSVFITISWLKYRNFTYHDFDLAIFAHGLRNLVRGEWHSTILGHHQLGNHVQPILGFVVPLYAVVQDPRVLLVLQSLALALAAVPLYALARRHLALGMAWVVPLVYWLHPALHHVNVFEFHPVVFAVPCWFAAYDAWERKCFGGWMAWCVLALACKENMPLVLLTWSGVAWGTGRRGRWVWVPLAVGSAWLWVTIAWILPHFNQLHRGAWLFYAHLGATPLEALTTLVREPHVGWALLVEPNRVAWYSQLVGPLAFLPLADPWRLLLVLPLMLQHALSARLPEQSVFFHYPAPILPWLLIATTLGMARLLRWRMVARYASVVPAVLLGMTIIAFWQLSPFGRAWPTWSERHLAVDPLDATRDRMVAAVPSGAPVVATFDFLSHLTQRDELYSLHYLYLGRYAPSQHPFRLPEPVEWALIDWADLKTFTGFRDPGGVRRMREWLDEGQWGLMMASGPLTLWQQGQGEGSSELVRVEDALGDTAQVRFGDERSLVGIQASPVDDQVLLTLRWQAQHRSAHRWWLLAKLVTAQGESRLEIDHPVGYELAPLQRLQEGQVLEERLWWPRVQQVSAEPLYLELTVLDMHRGLVPFARVETAGQWESTDDGTVRWQTPWPNSTLREATER